MQPDLFHFCRPFAVVIALARRCAVALLPDMRHFVREDGQNVLIILARKIVGVHRQFMGCALVNAPGKTIRREVAAHFCLPLQRDQHLGQGTGEQFGVEEVLRLLKGAVLGRGDGFNG